MGSNLAYDLATNIDISLEEAIGWHLQGNHYPPIPKSMVQPCIDAIDAFYDESLDTEITLPEGVFYQGLTTAPAWAIIEQHHLHAWCERED